MPMYDRAMPLFGVDTTKYTVPVSNQIVLCTIPQISDEIRGAVQGQGNILPFRHARGLSVVPHGGGSRGVTDEIL